MPLPRAALILAALLPACKPEPDPDPDAPVFDEVARHPGAAFLSVGGTGPDDVWLVGAQPSPTAGPVVLHHTGGAWTPLDTGALHDLWWVHAFDGGPVFLSGGGATVLRVDGTTVTRTPTPAFFGNTLYGVWGAAPTDLWAVGGFAGRAGVVWRYDGTTWTNVDLPDDIPLGDDGEVPSLFKVWGRAADDVWIVGGHGTILHWDGAALSVVPSGTEEQLFTVQGDDADVLVVGGSTQGLVLQGGVDGFTDVTPSGAPLLQGLTLEDDGTVWVAGAGGFSARRAPGEDWEAVDLGFETDPQSVHALWNDGAGHVWGAGGSVLTPALNEGGACASVAVDLWEPTAPPTPDTSCPADRVDPEPDGSIARRWNELLLDSIRRDIPNPPVHARNLFHVSMAMYDAWAAYDDTADGVVYAARHTAADAAAARQTAISYAAYRVLSHRYAHAVGAATSLDCYAKLMDKLGYDPDDTTATGDDPIAVGNRVGQAIIDRFVDDGSNEANGYADPVTWEPVNPILYIDRPGTPVDDPDLWQQLNLGTAETQNGIILDSSVQPYIGSHWREVEPFALEADPVTGLYTSAGDGFPSVHDPDMAAWVVEVLRKTAELDVDDGVMMDIGPGALGDNPVGTNDGDGYATNPVTGAPYAPNLVARGDFTRVVAEMWADGPKSETPPGHWTKICNEVSDRLAPEDLVPFGVGDPVDRLEWDVGLYLAATASTHDAAISAWQLKREGLAPRPVTLIRWMAQNGQRSDAGLPGYHEDGLPLVPGLIELITEASSAPGERHHHLRWYVGEIAVWSWPGEPGDRAHDYTPLQWMRGTDWIPYQRRTFVTPAFPGFTSGHSTFSRAAAEALTAYTGSPWFPGGLHSFTAPRDAYLLFEEGPSTDVRLEWASYYDAADQAGQSRLWGGIHIWPDDRQGRINGAQAGTQATAKVRTFLEGTAR